MNDVGVNKELEFLSRVIALLDGAINAVGDAADCMQSQKLQDSADDIESAIEMLVIRELELEKVSEVLNSFDYKDNELYRYVDPSKCEIKTYGDTVELIDGNRRIFLAAGELDLDRIQKNSASEIEVP
ncbi:MAG: hypothetical protein KBC72_08165 [Acinetobacter sp.]|nr:hypothetical protein [Acinetobacter sp.]